MVVFWLVEKLATKSWFQLAEWSPTKKLSFFGFIALFAWTGLSLIYTENVAFGLSNLEGKMSLFIFPLVLYSLQLKRAEVWRIAIAFMISISLATIYLLFNSYLHYLEQGSWLTYHDFTAPFDGHAVFYSYYLFVCILLGVYRLTSMSQSKWGSAFSIIVIFISLAALVFSASKNVTVVSIVFGLSLLFKRYFKRGGNWKEVLALSLSAVVIISLAFQLNAVKQRMSELFSGSGMENYHRIKGGEVIGEFDNHTFNGSSLRLTFWYLGITELTESNRWLIGLSPGDRRDQMNKRYLEVGMRPYKNYNIHNQFIQNLVELGLIGLLIYLLIHFALLSEAYRKSNQLLLFFILAAIVFQMTESILERNKSIVFFMFFICLFQQFSIREENEDRHIRD